MREKLWRVAAAGNCAALAVAACFLPALDVLVGETPAPELTWRRSPADRVLLVVIDGLRCDAVDSVRMPCASSLARAGGGGTLRISSLVPSTIAGIHVLASGSRAPPLSFLEDFGATGRAVGGVFAAVRAAGGRSHVSGPALWTDRFGKWIDASLTVATVAATDEPVVDAALGAVASGEFALQVVHLGRTDDLAHQHGADSEAYAQAVSWCDRALSRLIDAAPPGLSVLVTSDHGVTRGGGHAGPEADVLLVPLVVSGAGFAPGDLGTLPQEAVARLLCGEGLPSVDATALARTGVWPDGGAAGRLALAAVAVTLACGAWSSLAGATSARRQAITLHAGLWAVLALALLGRHQTALVLDIAVLFTSGRRGLGWRRLVMVIPAVVGGALLGGMRVLDALLALAPGGSAALQWTQGWLLLVPLGAVAAVLLARVCTKERWRCGAEPVLLKRKGLWPLGVLGVLAVLLGGAGLLGVCAVLASLGLATGVELRRSPRGGWLLGLFAVAAVAALPRLLGESVSLSTIDVRVTFAWVDGPLGVPAAAGTVFIRHALPAFSFTAGAAPSLRGRAAPVYGVYAAAQGAALAGEGLVALPFVLAGDSSTALGALGLGLLARVSSELFALFLGAAAAVWRDVALESTVRAVR